MFRSRYVPLVERERLSNKYLDLRQGTESVMKITQMFTKRNMFFPEFSASDQAQMTRCLSIRKTDIRQFISTQCYGLFLDMQEATRCYKNEMELQMRE